MPYCSWDMVCDGCNYFSFWEMKIKIKKSKNPKKSKLKKKKKKMPGDSIILHNCTKNHDHMLYCSWDMTCDRCNSFWATFCPFTLLTAQKIKIKKKMKKNATIYHHLRYVYQNLWSDDVWFLKYDARPMDRQTDVQTDGKSDIKRWVPHLKIATMPRLQTILLSVFLYCFFQ